MSGQWHKGYPPEDGNRYLCWVLVERVDTRQSEEKPIILYYNRGNWHLSEQVYIVLDYNTVLFWHCSGKG